MSQVVRECSQSTLFRKIKVHSEVNYFFHLVRISKDLPLGKEEESEGRTAFSI